MKVFVSSVIRGMGEFRGAAVRAVRTLGHEAVRAEDFGASPESPQRVCLAGVRAADTVLLLLGERYGDVQDSGLSPTHEEYREAREHCPVLVFVQEGVTREPLQDSFLAETRSWSAGHFTGRFSSADELRDAVIRELHRLDLARAMGPLDEAELLVRAEELISPNWGVHHGTLVVGVVGGPRQQILRPAELERANLAELMMKEALFGRPAVLNHAQGTSPRIDGHALVLEQAASSIRIDELGSVTVVLPAYEEKDNRGWNMVPSLIHEDIQTRIDASLRYAGWLLDQVDPLARITVVTPIVALLGAGYLPWRTRAEQEASPNHATGGQGGDRIVVHASPPHRHRASLAHDRDRLTEDLTVLLRRSIRA